MSTIPDRFLAKRYLIPAAAALLAIGGAAGGAAVWAMRPVVAMAPARIATVASLAGAKPRAIVSARGQVAEVYGGRFVLQDQSGRILVEARGRGERAVAAGQTVTVQGRMREGALRADFLVRPDGQVVAIGRGRHERGFHKRHTPR